MFDVTDIELVHGEDEGGVRRRAAELADEVGDVGKGRWWRSGGPGPRPVFIRDSGDSLPCPNGVRPSLLAGLLVHPPFLCYSSPFLALLPHPLCSDGAIGGRMAGSPFLTSCTLVPSTISTDVAGFFALRATLHGSGAWS